MGKHKITLRFNVILLMVSAFVFLASVLALIYDEELAATIDVIGIRIAMLIVAFAAFMSSTVFSFLIYNHNRTVTRANEDANRRGELFRNLQFTSANYSIIEFMDRMLIYVESDRYYKRMINTKNPEFHMFEKSLKVDDVYSNMNEYLFFSLKIPFRVIEGKLVSKITIEKLKFERGDQVYEFIPGNNTPLSNPYTMTYILYNEKTKRNNIIINLVVRKNQEFFNPIAINAFSKIKMKINITSLLGVRVRGTSELYFVNPEQIEGDGTNTYKINSSNIDIHGMPEIEFEHHDLV